MSLSLGTAVIVTDPVPEEVFAFVAEVVTIIQKEEDIRYALRNEEETLLLYTYTHDELEVVPYDWYPSHNYALNGMPICFAHYS